MIRAKYADFIGLIQAEVAAGNTSATAIGKAIGLRGPTVRRFAIRAGITLVGHGQSSREMWLRMKADPDAFQRWKEANGEAQRKAWARRYAREEAAIPVPSWVPADLRKVYRSDARKHGEEKAAEIARRMKREAMEAGL